MEFSFKHSWLNAKYDNFWNRKDVEEGRHDEPATLLTLYFAASGCVEPSFPPIWISLMQFIASVERLYHRYMGSMGDPKFKDKLLSLLSSPVK